MSISLDEARHVAKLARIELDGAELMSFQGKLNALLGHFEDIQHLDVAGVMPKPHAVSLSNVFADDVPGACLPREVTLALSAETKAGLHIVPTIIED
ncbi:MAG: Asp-tRNA(Asn)/Glu-tRNA(Gln) amidotransferase subunit GatC [Armatimonadetes bacterium]|nr:Asp-tRNA(Asn)/Glu-tRNA(Gln) amidotransferase subunit GatC [Armatimonadota bacterium]